MEFAIGAGEGEVFELAIFCHESGSGVGEGNHGTILFDAHAFEDGAGRLQLLPVAQGAGGEGEAFADGALASWMDVGGVADIGGHDHRGARGLLPDALLGLAECRMGAAVRGELDEEERQLFTPDVAPIGDHRREQLFVGGGLSGVRLALIPERAADREGLERRDHAVVQGRGAVVAAELGHDGGRGRGLALDFGFFHGLRVEMVPPVLEGPVGFADGLELIR
jgi:hypothetical protein